jgi:hypothetical protein
MYLTPLFASPVSGFCLSYVCSVRVRFCFLALPDPNRSSFSTPIRSSSLIVVIVDSVFRVRVFPIATRVPSFVFNGFRSKMKSNVQLVFANQIS